MKTITAGWRLAAVSALAISALSVPATFAIAEPSAPVPAPSTSSPMPSQEPKNTETTPSGENGAAALPQGGSPAESTSPAAPPAVDPNSATLPDGKTVSKPSDQGSTMGSSQKQGSGKMRAFAQPLALQQRPGHSDGMPGGIDVSGWQQNVNWQAAKNSGASFAFVKASEGPWAMNDYFGQQYNGSAQVGMIRGAYHFARPNLSSGASQAQAFVNSGGGWSADGITLPGVLDIEGNPTANSDGTNQCYGMAGQSLANWVADFTNRYRQLTGRDAVIYTAKYFWQDCVGNSGAFSGANPLWAAAYTGDVNWVQLYGGWAQFTFWQFSDNGPFLGVDSNVFNGSYSQLQTFARGRSNDTAIQAAYRPRAAALGSATTGEICGLKDGGCYQNFQRGQIHWTPATGAHATAGAIGEEWGANKWESGKLGFPTSDETCGLKGNGCYQLFQGGQIHWSGSSGAHSTSGAIGASWAAGLSENGALGYPTTDEVCGLKGGGCYQSFQGGQIHWGGANAFATSGEIAQAWAKAGSENGALGYPTTNLYCNLTGGGCFQGFQGGGIHYTAATGAHATLGPIDAAWGKTGWENGKLGYPTSDQKCGLKDGGCYQVFQGGQVHSNHDGAHATTGAIQAEWASLKSEAGNLGYPVGEETCGLAGNGCYQLFQGGQVHWSPAAGAHATGGAIGVGWAANGYEGGTLGYPLSDEMCGLKDRGCYQLFQGGRIMWSASSGAHRLGGAISGSWAQQGFEKGSLGYPTSEEQCGLVGKGCFQNFQGGQIHWSPASGAFSTRGAIHDAWAISGYESGKLGYPMSEETKSGSSVKQTFQHGSITWSVSQGAKIATH